MTWDHIAHSPNCSIAKARRVLGYEPRYRSLEAVREPVTWLMEHGVVHGCWLRPRGFGPVGIGKNSARRGALRMDFID